MTALFE